MNILFVATWYPLPPDNGSKNRTFHLLKALAASHTVSVVAFKPLSGPAHAAALIDAGLCHSAKIIDRHPFERLRLARLAGLLSPVPSHLAATQSRPTMDAIRRACRDTHSDVAVASDIAASLAVPQLPHVTRVLELHNFLPRWLSEQESHLLSPLQRLRIRLRVAKNVLFERRLYRRYDLVTMVSERDVQDARAMGCVAPRIAAVPNGFDPGLLECPRGPVDKTTLIYNGALTYGPNFDAVMWFGREVLPLVRKAHPTTTLTVTGSLEGVDTAPFMAMDGVRLGGYVTDLPKLLATHTACVIPLRTGAGTRIKVLEAMAAGVPVVTTPKGIEGLNLEPDVHCLVAASVEGFAAAVCSVLEDSARAESMAARARAHVRDLYGWDRIGRRFVELIEQATAHDDRASAGRPAIV